MRKQIILLCLLVFVSIPVFSQTLVATWGSGSTIQLYETPSGTFPVSSPEPISGSITAVAMQNAQSNATFWSVTSFTIQSQHWTIQRDMQTCGFSSAAIINQAPSGTVFSFDGSMYPPCTDGFHVLDVQNSVLGGSYKGNLQITLEPYTGSINSSGQVSANPSSNLGYLATLYFDSRTSEPLGVSTITGVALISGSLNVQILGASAAIGNSTTSAFGGEPVSTGTGNYLYQHTDFQIPGRGLPLILQRTYNAQDSYSGPLGANWTHSYNIALTTAQNGTVFVKWGDGHSDGFGWNGSTYVSPPGVYSVLVQNSDGSYLLTKKDRTEYSFSNVGVLLSITDRNGNATQLSYDGAGKLIAVKGAGGRSLSFSYDSSSRIAQVADPLGRMVKFSYDANGNLIQSTDPAGGVTSFSYDSGHRILSATLPTSKTLLHNNYDSQGRVVSQTNGGGNTWIFFYGIPTSADTTIIDGRGNSTIHTYDPFSRIVQIQDALSGTIAYTYDSNNNRTSLTNQNGNTTTFTYDTQGNVTGIVDPLGDSSTFAYDGKNNLLSVTDPKSNSTNFSYDTHGNLLSISDALAHTTSFSYDQFGELVSKKGPRGNTTSYAYDSFGNLTQITNALGHTTKLAYDPISRIKLITDANGNSTSTSYDALSRLVKTTDALNHQTVLAYDPVGNLVKLTDANGHSTSYGYDALNNLISMTDALGHLTRYSYDADNNRVSFTNAKGNSTSYAHDAVNRLTGSTDPLGFTTTYVHDLLGNVTSVTDPKGQTNKFVYDALNRLTGISYADGKTVSYAYDPNGNRTQMADPHGDTSYGYDALNRLVQITYPNNNVLKYSYDSAGNRSNLGYPDGSSVSYAYDSLNRLSSVADTSGGLTAYQYDPAGNLLGLSYPNKAGMKFQYDPANRLIQVTNSTVQQRCLLDVSYALDNVGNRTQMRVDGVPITFGYDALNRLTSAQLLWLKSTWAYDEVGNRLQQVEPLRITNYTYDADDRMLTAGPATYTYDANGNQISISRNKQGLPVTYQFDAANRLTAAAVGHASSIYSYDGDGNRITQTTSVGTYSYVNDINTALPAVLNEQGPDGNIDYTYGLGLIEEDSPTFQNFYHYDGLGSVIALTDAHGKPRAGYSYDPWGNALLNISDSVGTSNKYRFTGAQLDPGTQLYYLRARYYDPAVGRFISGDPLGGAARNPFSRNRYVYALSNPLVYKDPSGLFSLSSVVNTVSQAVSVADAGLLLSAVTLAQGPIELGGAIASALGGSGVAAVNNQVNSYLAGVQQRAAGALVSSTAVLEGVPLSNQQALTTVGQVVSVTNFATTAVSLLGAPADLTDFSLAYLSNGGSAIVPVAGALESLGEVVQGTISEWQALVPQTGPSITSACGGH